MTPVLRYVIKYQSPGCLTWKRSGNLNSKGVSNWITTYNRTEAEEEAQRQQKLMGPGFKYRAVPLLN